MLSKPSFCSLHPALLGAIVLTLVAATGCKRTDYRRRADRDVDGILQEKTAGTLWQTPPGNHVYPDPRSRFYDPTATDCPSLPNPTPVLNPYPVPPLVTGDPLEPPSKIDLVSGERKPDDELPGGDSPESIETPEGLQEAIDPPLLESLAPAGVDSLRIVPIPESAWEPLPESCLNRMFEFTSVQAEYERSFGHPAPQGSKDIPRVTLENIMELALINSRAYQTRKEALYITALRLTGQRYQYDLNPRPFDNGSAANYRNFRSGGATIDTLGIPTSVGVQKSLTTGGQFLASFANDVVLTFNGPQGFTADIGSALLFDFQQTIFQTDIQLEPLTQQERDVVYSARDLIRFRRGLFRDLSAQYYNLLLSYRSIEIGTQDYFSNQRAFLQGRAEYTEAGRLPRVQVDQFEQNALRSRSELVASCNNMETSLDRLKLAIGVPPEMPFNLRLTELEALSTTDQLTVAQQLVRRTQAELQTQHQTSRVAPIALLNAAAVLTERLLDIEKLASPEGKPRSALTEVASRLAVLEARNQADVKRAVLDEETFAEDKRQSQLRPQAGDSPEVTALDSPLRAYLRTVDVIESLLVLSYRSLEAETMQQSPDAPRGPLGADPRRDQLKRFAKEFAEVNSKMDNAVEKRELGKIRGIKDEATVLLGKAEQLATESTSWLISGDRQAFLGTVEATVAEVIQLSEEVISQSDSALPKVDVEEEEAMMTALVQRLDLMNRRAELADNRRAVKLAADDLRSIMDLRATHILRTRDDANTPFDFSLNDSETRLSLALDTPLNRRNQRNVYRLALIDYNRTLRNLIESEDTIKLDIRQDLRQLRLRRDQYEIAIASAALAYERVVSTRMQLQFAIKDVVARDFLEAQQAYTAALSSVARQHIAYILDRIELFYDMEGIQLDSTGFWVGLENDSLQPPVNLDFRGTNPFPYGQLVPGLRYSKEILSTE